MTFVEVVRVLSVAARVETGRLTEGPAPLLARLRAEGLRGNRRSTAERGALVRAIGWVDRCFPGGPNCYRRVLLEIALDRDAAGRSVCFGLNAGAGPGTGHAYFANEPLERRPHQAEAVFDVVFEM
jgi:hypothetical protein